MTPAFDSLARHADAMLEGAARHGVVPRLGSVDAVVTYHAVGEPHGYGNVSRSRFRRDLAYLTAHFDVVDLPAVLEGTDDEHSRVALTFDDGYEGFARVVLPLLEEFDIPATVFACAGAVRGDADAVRRRLAIPLDATGADGSSTPEPPALLSSDQLRTLAAHDLVTVGNHTRTHVDLAAVEDAARRRDEIVGAQRDLGDVLGVDVERFCYPYGRVSRESAALVRDTHDLAVTTVERPVAGDDAVHRVPRITAHVPESRFRWLLHGTQWWVRDLLDGSTGSQSA